MEACEPAVPRYTSVYRSARLIPGASAACTTSSREKASIQPTELLHEAWLKLSRSSSAYADRGHFFSVAARAMRQILVDQARARLADKRGGGGHRTTVAGLAETDRSFDLLELDTSLDRLAEIDAVTAEVVILRTFGGLTVDEVAALLGASARTIARKWRFGRAFLEQALGVAAEPGPAS